MNVQQICAYFILKNKYISYFCGGILNLLLHNVDYVGQKAVVSESIVDMSSSFPLCVNPVISGQETVCRRANQCLYNEVVNCVGVLADAVKIDFDKVIYGYGQDGQPYSSFWTDSSGITLVKKINVVLLAMIPSLENERQPKICLSKPWHSFSVGTYFVHIPSKDTDLCYAVYVPCFAHNTFSIEYVDKEKALCVYKRTEQEMRALFVSILYGLIDHAHEAIADGVVPYVWGGCSYITPNNKQDFFYTDGAWHRPSENQTYNGYDCSGLIWRIAQCVGISFPWKVSKMIVQHCPIVDEYSQLKEGDIIWFEGHVMVVADIEKSLLIEAAGYSAGYGCVHCVSLEQRFADIKTYEDLINAYSNKRPVGLLNAQGYKTKEVYVKLLKLIP